MSDSVRNVITAVMPYILFILLSIAAFTDIKSRRVPVWITVAGAILKLTELIILEPEHLVFNLVMSAVLFGVLFLGALFGGMGGADCLLGAMIGLYMGIYGVYSVMIAFVLSIPHAIYAKKHKEDSEYPFVPYLLVSSAIIHILTMILA